MAQVGDLTVNIHANVDADAVEAQTLDALADRLVDRILTRFRERLPSEVRAMAEEAAGAPGLDELSLFALADWLEENSFGAISRRVRRLAVKGGDVLVLQATEPLSKIRMAGLRREAQALTDELAEAGKAAFVIVLPFGLKLTNVSAGRGAS